MVQKKFPIHVSDSLGSVSAEILAPADMRFLYVFAHGAGAGMNHPFMVRLSTALATFNIGTLRYNFRYMEKGSKRPDPAPIAEATVNGVLVSARELYPSIPLLAGGKSFGGRMTSQALAKGNLSRVSGVVFAGFPLHPAGKPASDRAAHLTEVNLPMLFLQGTRDALAEMNLMEGVCAELPAANLVKFQGADHSFKAGKLDLIPQLAAAINAWADTEGLSK